MSAKKRGPGRPPKSKNKKPSAAAVHTVPQHFWAQVGAILLAVVTAIITVGLFGVGGVLPVKLAAWTRWLVGWTAFAVPLIFAVQIIQVFRQPEDRVPAVIWVTTILFFALLSGTFQLSLSDPKSLAVAQTGRGGGTVGWIVADGMLRFVNVPLAILISVVLMLILFLFIFSISPKAVLDAMRDFVGRESDEEASNRKVAKALSDQDKIKVGGLGKGEIAKEPVEKPGKKGLLARRRAKLAEATDDDKDAAAKAERNLEVRTAGGIEKADTRDVVAVINNSNWQFPAVDLLTESKREAVLSLSGVYRCLR